MISKLSIFLTFCLIYYSNCNVDWSGDIKREKWMDYSRELIEKFLNRKINGNVAKNVVFFLGDGMGVSTVTAGRIWKGQLQNRSGEEEITNMEKLDHLALSKTYNIDAQTADSAGTATAFETGVKTRIRAIGVDGNAIDCKTIEKSKLESILDWAHYAGKSVGIVTTTRITHASPAALYAHVHERDMEAYDGKKLTEQDYEDGCRDIASQLIDDNQFINVIFGGGKRKFLPNNTIDPISKRAGDRIDGRNLLEDWKTNMKKQNKKHKYLDNRQEFLNLNSNEFDHVLGLFNWDHMEYESDRVRTSSDIEPSIIEMTEKAIQILKKNPNGYLLFVEGGRIDQAHHNNNARRALDDFVVFDDAIGKSLKMVSLDNTLVVVSADHSHVFTIGGYAVRGNPIFGTVITTESGKLSKFDTDFTSLAYTNGASGLDKIRTENITNNKTEQINYQQEALIKLDYETHGGEEVAIYASGPMAYLFDGTVEQSHIAHHRALQ
ncbi:alkaline tissue-nonspecific isozyme [Brachionus plicatilis]|uniref:Alkaline phosphatase, tissue-nonspecific isozyme n=1 Tax=Brachionus plicatilis TaxID=10195 RepID=A0A3M7PTP4_BRAPC|nr:alkaline tissue-nonspecific isozyme [Brachionus plicatilis]